MWKHVADYLDLCRAEVGVQGSECPGSVGTDPDYVLDIGYALSWT